MFHFAVGRERGSRLVGRAVLGETERGAVERSEVGTWRSEDGETAAP